MARTMANIQNDFFALLTSRTNIDLDFYKSIRIYVTNNEFDALVSDIVHLKSVNFGYYYVASLYSYQGYIYLILPSCFEGNDREGLGGCDVPNEIWLYHIVHNRIMPLEKACEDDLLMNVFTENNVKDIPFETVIDYFPKLTAYHVDDIVLTDTPLFDYYLRQLCLEMLCKSSSSLFLPFEEDTLKSYLGIANAIDVNIPIDNVLRSIISYSWKFCFIDLYRCHERLFMLAWVDEFKSSMQSTLGLQELYENMKRVYSTEHHEDKNIASLYNSLPDEILNIQRGKEEENATSIAKSIYRLRNTIVRYQKSDDKIDSMSDSEWNKIIQFLLMSIPYLYSHLAKHIEELPDV